ncbi:hypothetical protein OHT01_00760 [Streptomyces sp. NBC_00358]
MCRELFNRVGAVQREQFLVQAGGAFRPVRYGAPQFVGQAAWVEVGYAQRFRVDRACGGECVLDRCHRRQARQPNFPPRTA